MKQSLNAVAAILVIVTIHKAYTMSSYSPLWSTTSSDAAEIDTSTTDASTVQTSTPGPTYAPLPPPYIYIEMQFANAVNPPGITTQCVGRYSQQFQNNLNEQLTRAKNAMLSDPTFCPGTYDAALSIIFVSANGNYNEADIIFGYSISPVGANTLSQMSNCGWQLSAWMSDYNNWRQPIWGPISGCPSLTPSGSGLQQNSVEWYCP